MYVTLLHAFVANQKFFIIIDIIGYKVFQFGQSMSQRIVKMWYT